MNKAANIIKEFEGCKLRAYKCPAGVWTIGFGTTDGVYPDKLINLETAEVLLERDLKKFEEGVKKLVKIPLTDNQLAALVSFAYNVGLKALEDSTLLRKLNMGDIGGAADELKRWNKAGGKVLAGLTRRRKAERALFLEV